MVLLETFLRYVVEQFEKKKKALFYHFMSKKLQNGAFSTLKRGKKLQGIHKHFTIKFYSNLLE